MEYADIPTFGEALALFRTRAGLSQQRLADQLGRNRRSVAGWEGGEYLPKTKGDMLELVRILELNDEETISLLKAAGMDPSPSPPLWNVPHKRNPYFTGRDDLFDRLDQHLAPPGHSAAFESCRVALTQPQAIKGLGGIGKTQIAVEYAYRSRDLGRYIHTFWVNAASEETIIASFVTIADLLSPLAAHNETDQHKLVEAVKRWLEQCKQRWLLIFDNADDIVLVRDYLPQQGNGNILLTTRAHAVGSLATSVEVETMGFLEGTHLLLHRAQRFEHASDEEVNQAGNIVVALDHFPLALDQAGAYIEETQCSFESYLALYRTHRQTLLTQRGVLSTDYPYSVATTWLLSFQQVQQANPAAAKLLYLCSFLAPDRIPEELLREGAAYWPASLQQAVANPLLFQQLIADLLKFSLVKRLVEEHAFSIHRLVQAVQKDRMTLETQRRWAERVVRAINNIFPRDPQNLALWPQYLRYLDQAQACNTLIEYYMLQFIEAADLLNRTGLYLWVRALYTIAEPLYQRALQIQEQQLGVEHPTTATSLNNLAIVYHSQGKYEQAEHLYVRVLDNYEQQLGPEHPATAISLNNLAELYRDQGKYEQAELLCARALAIYEQHLGAEHPDTAQALNNLALLYFEQGKYEQAELMYVRALQIREQQLGPEHPATATSLSNLATLYCEQGRYSEAEPLYQRALSTREQQLGPEHPATATSLDNLAVLYKKQGKYKQAELMYVRALQIREQQLGPEHPDTATSLSNLAVLYKKQGKYEQAEPLHQHALQIREQQLGPEHPDTATSLSNLATLYCEQGRYSEAEPLYQRALSTREQQLGPEHPATAISLNNLAELYRDQGKYEQAEPLYARALVINQQLGAEHPTTATSLNNLALLYFEQGKYEQAKLYLEQALAIREQQLGPEHPDTATSLSNLAFLYEKQGKYKQAELMYVRALQIREQQLGPEHPDTATSLSNLARLYQAQSKYAESEMFLKRALVICETMLGRNHPSTQTIRAKYASTLHAMGREGKAKRPEESS